MGVRDLAGSLSRRPRAATATFIAAVRDTTPGQYWTSALALLVTLPVLLFGLPPDTTLVASAPDPQQDSTAPPVALPPSAPTDPGIVVGPPRSIAVPDRGPVDGPINPGDGDQDVADPAPASDDGGPDPGSGPSESCAPAEAVEPVLEALADVEFVPRKSIVLLIGGLAGCSEIDTTILPIAALAEIGSGLPDPGLELPVPTVPFVEIPPAAVNLVQPFRDDLAPICDTAALGSPLILIGLSTWPTNLDEVLLVPVNQVLLVCGQLLAPEATQAAATGWLVISWSEACTCWQTQ